jgi:hypothetical protein
VGVGDRAHDRQAQAGATGRRRDPAVQAAEWC